MLTPALGVLVAVFCIPSVISARIRFGDTCCPNGADEASVVGPLWEPIQVGDPRHSLLVPGPVHPRVAMDGAGMLISSRLAGRLTILGQRVELARTKHLSKATILVKQAYAPFTPADGGGGGSGEDTGATASPLDSPHPLLHEGRAAIIEVDPPTHETMVEVANIAVGVFDFVSYVHTLQR